MGAWVVLSYGRGVETGRSRPQGSRYKEATSPAS